MNETQVKPEQEQGGERKPALFGRVAMICIAVLAGLFVLGSVLAWRTNDVMGNLPFLKQATGGIATVGGQKQLVDETPWKTAAAAAALAVSQEELVYARQAERLADHEVDQAFATALRKASLQQRKLTGAALDLQTKVTQLQGMVATDQTTLSAAVKGSDDEQIDQAQLGLDQDQLNDAKGDLARASGDERGAIQQELTAHEAEMKTFDATGGQMGQVATISVRRYRTLAGLMGAWSRQRQRYQLLMQAKGSALRDAAALQAEHNAMESRSGGLGAAGSDTTGATADRLAGLKRLSLERQMMSIYDDRIETDGQLADVYARWGTQVLLQHRIVEHLTITQGMMIPAILLIAILLSAGAKRLAERESLDKRRMRTLSWIALLVIQVGALIAILLVLFGPPKQLSTVVGLVTAGLTVALQDFILAFVGWFILMGRTGIGVGDVVEINSVAGEVVEIGLFRRR
jgi:hypothetical protein